MGRLGKRVAGWVRQIRLRLQMGLGTLSPHHTTATSTTTQNIYREGGGGGGGEILKLSNTDTGSDLS